MSYYSGNMTHLHFYIVNWHIDRLDMDYVDLYLMHTPIGDHLLETYDALLALKEKGLAKYVKLC